VRAKIHELIDRLDDDILQPALHAAIDALPDDAVPRVLKRMLNERYLHPQFGFRPALIRGQLRKSQGQPRNRPLRDAHQALDVIRPSLALDGGRLEQPTPGPGK